MIFLYTTTQKYHQIHHFKQLKTINTLLIQHQTTADVIVSERKMRGIVPHHSNLFLKNLAHFECFGPPDKTASAP